MDYEGQARALVKDQGDQSFSFSLIKVRMTT